MCWGKCFIHLVTLPSHSFASRDPINTNIKSLPWADIDPKWPFPLHGIPPWADINGNCNAFFRLCDKVYKVTSSWARFHWYVILKWLLEVVKGWFLYVSSWFETSGKEVYISQLCGFIFSCHICSIYDFNYLLLLLHVCTTLEDRFVVKHSSINI